jgi:hypothetical protein
VVVKRFIVFSLLLAAPGVGHAVAQSCGTASTGGMTRTQIIALVSNKYACVGNSPSAQWNELHDSSSGSGNVLDYKLGPAHATDPSNTPANPSGSFNVTGPGGDVAPGVIIYTYDGNAYGYYIVNNLTPPRYSFCGQSGGAPQLAVTISASHC